MSMVTIIGRGHSGTRAMAQTLHASGVYMGATLNDSADLIPPEDMYEACRVMGRHVTYLGNLRWDFAKLHTMRIDPRFKRLIESYLGSVLDSKAQHKGWKIPETTLVYPWIVRLFPHVRYIYWMRDPRDCILGEHLTDDLAGFGIPYERTDDVFLRRAISWKYQEQIVRATRRPRHFLKVHFEYFVLDQERTLTRLRQFLGFRLARLAVRPDSVYRWKGGTAPRAFEILHDELRHYGYWEQGDIDEMLQEALARSGPKALDEHPTDAGWKEQPQKAKEELASSCPATVS